MRAVAAALNKEDASGRHVFAPSLDASPRWAVSCRLTIKVTGAPRDARQVEVMNRRVRLTAGLGPMCHLMLLRLANFPRCQEIGVDHYLSSAFQPIFARFGIVTPAVGVPPLAS